MKINLHKLPALAVRRQGKKDWGAGWEGDSFHCVGNTLYDAVGDLVHRSLESPSLMGELPETKSTLIGLYRTKQPCGSDGHYSHAYNFYELGKYCVEHAEELGMEFVVHQQHISFTTRAISSDDTG